MQNINTSADLREAIQQLESKRAEEEKMLRAHFHLAVDSLKPVNLIKSAFTDATGSHELKGTVLSTTVGLTAGFLSKLLFQGISANPIRKVLGSALMFGITKVVAKNPETVKLVGKRFFKFFKRKIGGRINKSANDEPNEAVS